MKVLKLLRATVITGNMFRLCFLVLINFARVCTPQDEDGPYRGKLIGKINSYHHQVSGDVYAVDEWTLLLVNFNYDGAGDDTFFWAGDGGRVGPQGFIVPDQNGKTNILERYYNEDVRLTLPEGKRVSRLRWFSVYDISTQNAFGDVELPEGFTAPAVQRAPPLQAASHVTSGPLQLIDAVTILIPELRYDGSGEEVYFWTGVGPQPSGRGQRVPDEYGYLEPLGAYNGSDVLLRLPGGSTVFDVSWLALYDAGRRATLASVLLPERPDVPPAPLAEHTYRSELKHCKQLHRDMQVSWEVFGNQITIQLAGLVGVDEYMSFGISGSDHRSEMLGADVAVAQYDPDTQRALATDYNITARAPCVQVLGAWRGVCRDTAGGGLDDNQVFTASRQDGLTVVTYRRTLQPGESMDRAWRTDAPQYVVWGAGALDAAREPSFHRLYPRRDLALRLDAEPPNNDCVTFTVRTHAAPAPWETAQLWDPALRVFRFALGPAGGARGMAGRASRRGGGSPPLAWYVNGQLAPDLQLRRGLAYTFEVRGGSDPHSAGEYHPLMVTTEPLGGVERLGVEAQREIRVLAGAALTRRGRLTPLAAGPLCIARHPPGADRRRDDDYDTFRSYNRSLRWECPPPPPPPALLHVAPNASWPDLVYYHSFTHTGMGGRIFVVDRPRRGAAASRTSRAPPAAPAPALALALAVVALALLV